MLLGAYLVKFSFAVWSPLRAQANNVLLLDRVATDRLLVITRVLILKLWLEDLVEVARVAFLFKHGLNGAC